MNWEFLNPTLTLDGDARTFVLSGVLPVELAEAQRGSPQSPTDVWKGTVIGGDEHSLPDHVLVVRWAEFDPPDRLMLVGAIEGPRPESRREGQV